MPIQITEEPWVPAQEKFETGPEYRSLEAGRMSRKRAREVEENGLEDEEMVDDEAVERLRKASRPTYKQVVGKASGRAWKAAATRASLIMKPRTGAQKSWDDRMKEKAAKKQFQATLKEAKDAGLAERKAEHTRRAAKKDQKEENRKRTTQTPTIATKLGAKSKERKKQKALKMV